MTEQGKALLGDGIPDTQIDVREVFGLDIDLKVPAFSKRGDHVPPIDESYLFNHETTLAILAGFAHNRRVMIQGFHGTGKSSQPRRYSSVRIRTGHDRDRSDGRRETHDPPGGHQSDHLLH